MRISVCASILLSFFITSAGWTQDHEANAPCASVETTAEQRDCAGRDYQRADAQLNKIYRQVMSNLEDEGHKTALKNAQQAWLKYRDANCEYESYLNQGGTIYSVIYTICMTRMTVTKTKELREILKTLDKN